MKCESHFKNVSSNGHVLGGAGKSVAEEVGAWTI